MKFYRSLKIIIILCFFSFQINAKDEVLRLAITTTAENSGSNRFSDLNKFELIFSSNKTSGQSEGGSEKPIFPDLLLSNNKLLLLFFIQ